MTDVILLDIDGVLVDFTSAYLDVLAAQTGRRHSADDVTCFDYAKCVATPMEDARVWAHIADTPGFVYGLPTYDGWREFLGELRGLGRVVACTSPASAQWVAERYQWLLDTAGFEKRDIVIARSKELVRGDFLIDDATHNIDEWEAAHEDGYGILFERPWSRGSFMNPRGATYTEILSWVSRFELTP